MAFIRTDRGVTIVEILVAIAILGLVITIVSFSFSGLNSKQALDKSANLVAAVLNEARSMTLSSIGGTQYGVYLEAGQVTLFQGSVYSAVDPNNLVTTLNPLTAIRSVSLSGSGSSVVFDRLTGATDNTGTLEVYLVSDPASFYTITMTSTGIAEIN